MLDLDARDLSFWTREAQKKVILDRMEAYNTARMAMVKDEDYRMIIMQMDWQLRMAELTPEEQEAAANPEIIKAGEN